MTRLSLALVVLTAGFCWPTSALAETFEVLARASKTTLNLRVRAAENHHLAEDYPAKLVLRTMPETAMDDVIDLSGRIPELITGIEVELPAVRPLVIDGELDVGVCDLAGTCTAREVGFQVNIRRRKPLAQVSLDLRPVRRIQSRSDIVEAAGVGGLRKVVKAASLDGGLRAALNEAEQRADPLLAVFKTRWCPPCRRLQAEVLDDPEYAELLGRFVVTTFDADLSNSWEAKSRWSVGGYPTVVICSFDGEVVWRQVGYDGAAEFAAALSAVHDDLERALPEDGDVTPEQALARAERARHAQDREAATSWLARVPAGASVDGAILAEVQAFLARTDPDPGAGAAALEAVLLAQALEPSVPLDRQMWWWYRAARLWEAVEDPEAAALAWERGCGTARQRLAAGVEGPAAADTWAYLGTAEKGAGHAAASVVAWAHAADGYSAVLTGGRPAELADAQANPGVVLELAEALLQSGRTEELRILLGLAVDAHPDEATFYRIRARAERELGGDLEQALADAGTAHRLAAGDLRLRTADLWSELLVDAGRPEEAVALLHEVLDDLVLPEDPEIRTHRYAEDLRQRLAELEPEAADEEL